MRRVIACMSSVWHPTPLTIFPYLAAAGWKTNHSAAGESTFHPWSDCKYSSRPPTVRQESPLLAPLPVQLQKRRFDAWTPDIEQILREFHGRTTKSHKPRLLSFCPYLKSCESSTSLARSKSFFLPSVTRRSYLPTTTWTQLR